ncbi:MAG: DNA-binding response regulator [Candidatus Peribacteria bacterium]|nr:DNA-binding response regulator [Candidatus Peribacteria bacterium]
MPRIKTAKASRSVLIVDNDKILVRVLEMKFKKEGFHVTVCHDGQAAIDALKKEVFHGVILDLMMPVKNGYEVLEARVDTINAATPVFVMSGVASPDAALKAEALGARKFFMKFRMPLKDVVDEISDAVLGN